MTGARISNPSLESAQGFDAKTASPAAVAKQAYAGFLAQLQAAVRAGDRTAVIASVAFPLRVNGADGARLYLDAASVERDFDRIFTGRVKRAILKQAPERLSVRERRAMVGHGELWLVQTCPHAACSASGPVRIASIRP